MGQQESVSDALFLKQEKLNDNKGVPVVRATATILRKEGFKAAKNYAMDHIHEIGKFPHLEVYMQQKGLVDEIGYPQIRKDWYSGKM